MPERAIRPGRLRRRLTLAFTLAAGLSAAALGAGSYVLVREARLSDSVDRALEQSTFNLVLANELLADGAGPDATDELLAAYERRGAFEVVGRTGERTFSTSLSVRMRQVPDDLRGLVQRGDLAYERVGVAGARYLVVGGRVAGADTELYYLFSEDRLFDDLAHLRNILLGGVAALVLLGALAGMLLARRTLRPVARASAAARSLAEGLLETRLPVESADEFGAWAASFNEMADALEAKIAALSQAQARERRFTADVAHELRTPLTALVAEASLLADHLERIPPEARRPAELLVQDVARLRDLVEDLIEISRIDAGQARVRRERVDLAALVPALVRSRRWDGRVRVAAAETVVETDPRRVERIVGNLVGNALEHGVGVVEVRVAQDPAGALVEVSDRGRGIPPEELSRIFDRFYKGDPARAGPGSGLGLAIALENARLLGGELLVESDLGGGSRFTLRLPVTRPLPHGEPTVATTDEDREHPDEGGMP
jgi:two-component system, OmpR family, sensor histidine kinase MtrB